MITYSRLFFSISAAVLMCGCSSKTEPAANAPAMTPVSPGKAPDVYKVKFETSKGDFVLQVNKEWAPNGAQRFYELAQTGFFDNSRFFRVITGFMVQFGINADPKISATRENDIIPDDPVKQSNNRGRITFATRGPNSRTTQVFINLADNPRLDGQGFAPFGEVVSGMNVVDGLYAGYGEGAPGGNGPSQPLIQSQGNEYLQKDFPLLDYIKKTSVQ
jgi:peptidyl-prolyl cis-trans isomerase A (cyclophilin A)